LVKMFFFLLTRVNPSQPIWLVTRSLNRINHRVGFKNYARDSREGGLGHMIPKIMEGHVWDPPFKSNEWMQFNWY
jgi:hypothetical protein